MTGKTRREGEEPPGSRSGVQLPETKRESSEDQWTLRGKLKPTVRESSGQPEGIRPTRREAPRKPEAQTTHKPRQPWLPSALAGRYHVIEELEARGGEADAFLVDDAHGQQFFAKIYRKGVNPKLEVFERISRAAPEHVIRLIEHGHSDGRYYEVLEYASHGSLRDLVQREGPKLAEPIVKAILRELSYAIAHVHGLDIEHRDLKPDNVLIRSRNPLDLVLTDFGIASLMEAASVRASRMRRTTEYAPPEATQVGYRDEDKCEDTKYEHTKEFIAEVLVFRTAWDYWSLGMILVEVLTGKHPFERHSDLNIVRRLGNSSTDEFVTGVDDPSWRKLCQGLLRRDPRKRWSKGQIEKWLKNPDDPSLVVAEEGAIARAGFRFYRRDYQTTEDLAAAFAAEWEAATDAWRRRKQQLHDWLIDELGLKPVADKLEQIDGDPNLDLDAQVFALIHALDPNRQLSFKGLELTEEKLKTLANRALTDARANEVLRALYRSRILSVASSLTGKSHLLRFESKWAQTENSWREAVDEYERLLRQVSSHGVNVTAFGLNDDERLTILLASATPGNAKINDLRAQAQKVSTRDARACPWFRDLGDPSKGGVPALLAISLLASAAEDETRRKREQEEAERAQARPANRQARLEQRQALTAPIGRAIGGIMGGIIGGIVGAVIGAIVVGIVILLWMSVVGGFNFFKAKTEQSFIWFIPTVVFGILLFICSLILLVVFSVISWVFSIPEDLISYFMLCLVPSIGAVAGTAIGAARSAPVMVCFLICAAWGLWFLAHNYSHEMLLEWLGRVKGIVEAAIGEVSWQRERP